MIISEQSSFTSAPISVPYRALNDVYLSVTGPGPVAIEMLEEDGQWRSFPETTFDGPTAQIVTVKQGSFRVVISGGPTTVEVRV